MNKNIIIIFSLVFSQLQAGIPIEATNFTSPVKHKIRLTGTFGELRPKHFHAGIDISSSRGVQGDSIYSAEVGYISRIKIQRGGYGRAIYVSHPNGYTTVYGHLKGFNPTIDQYVKNKQIADQSYEIEAFPAPGELPLLQGEHIGYMGNSGRSYGAHLHFEIRDTDTDEPMNPHLFRIKPKDTTPPVLRYVRILGLNDDYKQIYNQKIADLYDKKKNPISHSIEVPLDKVGISFYAFDTYDATNNKNGIHKVELYEDDLLKMHAEFNKFSFSETKMIDAYTNYEENDNEVLCYKLPGNRLSVLKHISEDGFIYLDTFNHKNIKLVLSDFDGNTRVQNLKLIKSKKAQIFSTPIATNAISAVGDQTINAEDISVSIPDGAMIKNAPVEVRKVVFVDGSAQYIIGQSNVPLIKPIKVRVKIPEVYRGNPHFAFMRLGNTPTFYGQTIVGDEIEAELEHFGTYAFVEDWKAPTINPINFTTKAKNQVTTFTFKLEDNISCRWQAKQFSYHVYIDGVWTVCEYKDLNEILYVPVESLGSGSHNITITVKDMFENAASWQGDFEKL
jgi:murein DD-endopeptidase MepM/ murein hydrolase activator NlpD